MRPGRASSCGDGRCLRLDAGSVPRLSLIYVVQNQHVASDMVEAAGVGLPELSNSLMI